MFIFQLTSITWEFLFLLFLLVFILFLEIEMVRDNDSYLLKEAEISKTQTVGRLSAKGKDDLVGLIRQPTSS